MIALAAAQGLGVALSPAFIVHDALRRGDLVRVLPEWQLPDIGVRTHPAGTVAAGQTRSLIDFPRRTLPDRAPLGPRLSPRNGCPAPLRTPVMPVPQPGRYLPHLRQLRRRNQTGRAEPARWAVARHPLPR